MKIERTLIELTIRYYNVKLKAKQEKCLRLKQVWIREGRQCLSKYF